MTGAILKEDNLPSDNWSKTTIGSLLSTSSSIKNLDLTLPWRIKLG